MSSSSRSQGATVSTGASMEPTSCVTAPAAADGNSSRRSASSPSELLELDLLEHARPIGVAIGERLGIDPAHLRLELLDPRRMVVVSLGECVARAADDRERFPVLLERRVDRVLAASGQVRD